MSNVKQLFRQEIKFIAGAAKIQQIPRSSTPEIAFIGKSNVGKSSLINAICNRRDLARVSHTPGRTQQINFFSVADNTLILVDLPGYGFAQVPINIKNQWEKLILYYFETQENLRLVNVLVDARRGIKDHDIHILNLLSSYNRNFQIVFTKIDQINNIDELLDTSKTLLVNLGYSCNLTTTSSRNKEGTHELKASFTQVLSSYASV